MSLYYDIPENYLNPSDAAKEEPQRGGCDMNAFLAELQRNPNWLAEYELKQAIAHNAPLVGVMGRLMGGTK